jgi:hypothetical protein
MRLNDDDPKVGPIMVPRLLRVSTAARILDISRQAVHQGIVRGDIPAFKIFSEHEPASSTPAHPTKARGAWRIKEADLLAYIAKCEAKR